MKTAHFDLTSHSLSLTLPSVSSSFAEKKMPFYPVLSPEAHSLSRDKTWGFPHETALEKSRIAHWQAEILDHQDPEKHLPPAKAGHQTIDSASSGYEVIHFQDASILAHIAVYQGHALSNLPNSHFLNNGLFGSASIFSSLNQSISVEPTPVTPIHHTTPDVKPTPITPIHHTTPDVKPTPPVIPVVGKITLDSITNDNVINQAESKSMIDITGSVSGDIVNGSRVKVDLAGEIENTRVYDGKFSLTVSGQQLADASEHQISVSVVGANAEGDHKIFTATEDYSVHTHLQAGISLEPITTLSLSEADHSIQIKGHVSGRIQPSETVTVTVDDHQYHATLGKNGDFTASIAGQDAWDASHITAQVNETDKYGNTASASASEAITDKVATLTVVIDNATDMVRSLVTLKDLHAFHGEGHDALWHLEHPFSQDGHANWGDSQKYQIWLNPLEWLQTKNGHILDDGFLYSLTGHYVTVTHSQLEQGIEFYHPNAGDSLFGDIYNHLYDSSHLWIRAGDDATHSKTEELTLNNLPYSWNENTQVQVIDTLSHFLSDKTFHDTNVHLNIVYNQLNGAPQTEHVTVQNVDGHISLNALTHVIDGIKAVPVGDINSLMHTASDLSHNHSIYTFTNVHQINDHDDVIKIAINPYFNGSSTSDSLINQDVKHMLQPIEHQLSFGAFNDHHSVLIESDEHHQGLSVGSLNMPNLHGSHDDLFLHDSYSHHNTAHTDHHLTDHLMGSMSISDVLDHHESVGSIDHLLTAVALDKGEAHPVDLSCLNHTLHTSSSGYSFTFDHDSIVDHHFDMGTSNADILDHLFLQTIINPHSHG